VIDHFAQTGGGGFNLNVTYGILHPWSAARISSKLYLLQVVVDLLCNKSTTNRNSTTSCTSLQNWKPF